MEHNMYNLKKQQFTKIKPSKEDKMIKFSNTENIQKVLIHLKIELIEQKKIQNQALKFQEQENSKNKKVIKFNQEYNLKIENRIAALIVSINVLENVK